MNKLILCLFIGAFVCTGVSPSLAQKTSSGTATVPAMAQKDSSAAFAAPISKTKNDVKDYLGFLEYNASLFMNATGRAKKIHLGADRVMFPDGKKRMLKNYTDGSRDEFGALSSDKRLVSVFNRRNLSFIIFDSSEKEIKKLVLSKFPESVEFSFSPEYIYSVSPSFDGPGGFEIYSANTGQLLRKIKLNGIEGYAASSTGKYFAVTFVEAESSFFRVYSATGDTLWECAIDPGTAEVVFSLDDRYACIKLPEYWVKAAETAKHKTARKTKRVYLVDISKKRIIFEGNYND